MGATSCKKIAILMVEWGWVTGVWNLTSEIIPRLVSDEPITCTLAIYK
jgi:hypothetical protein